MSGCAKRRGCFILVTLWVSVSISGCSLVVPIYPCHGELLAGATLAPLVSVPIYVATQQPSEPGAAEPLQGESLQAWLDDAAVSANVDPVGHAVTDPTGRYETGIWASAPSPVGWLNAFLPPAVIDVVYVYVKVDGVWRSITVPLSEPDQSEILDPDRRRIILPTIYVSDAGLSLTPGQ